jgi:hypothetical protein
LDYGLFALSKGDLSQYAVIAGMDAEIAWRGHLLNLVQTVNELEESEQYRNG